MKYWLFHFSKYQRKQKETKRKLSHQKFPPKRKDRKADFSLQVNRVLIMNSRLFN